MEENIIEEQTDLYRGMLIRNLPKERVITFVLQTVSPKFLQDLLKRSGTYISQVRHGKRKLNAVDGDKIFKWYQEVSQSPINESVSVDDIQPMYYTQDVEMLENDITHGFDEIALIVKSMKAKSKTTLRGYKKRAREAPLTSETATNSSQQKAYASNRVQNSMNHALMKKSKNKKS